LPQILRQVKEENEGRHKSKDGQIFWRQNAAETMSLKTRQGRALGFL
jgi:hypothetical protein